LTRKQRGEKAEAAFLAKAADLRFWVAKPWARVRGTTWLWKREEVDSGAGKIDASGGPHGGYTFHPHGNSLRAYNASEIDVLVAYVVGLDAWYLIPVEEFRKYRAMKLFPREQEEEIKI